MKTINAALVAQISEQISTDYIQKSLKSGIDLHVYKSVNNITETERIDVYVFGSAQLKNISETTVTGSALIVLQENKEDIQSMYRRAVELSAFTILQLPVDGNTLAKTISSAYDNLLKRKADEGQTRQTGKAIGVISFKNGIGKSMIAYNLANRLGRYFPGNEVCLSDFNLPFSVNKAVIDTDSKFSWDTIRPLLKEAGALTKSRLFSILKTTQFNFSLLGGPDNFKSNTPLNSGEMNHLVTAMKDNFTVTLLDLPTITNEKDIRGLSSLDKILIVVGTDSASIINTKFGIDFLRENNPEILDKCIFVLNRKDIKKDRTQQVLAPRLGVDFIAGVEDDPEAVDSYLNQGKLFDDKSLVITNDLNQLGEAVFKLLF